MSSLSSINIKFKVDLAEFRTQLQNVSKEIKSASNAMKDIGSNLSTYVTLPVLAAGGAAVKFASDYEESLNKVNVAFGQSEGYVKNWSKSSLESFGIAEGTALDMAALFGDLGTSMGIPQKEAAKMSTSLVGLAGDLASFKNIGIDQATTALNGVFTGETESLKMLGVVMTEANLQAFALTKGIKTQVKDMTEAEKVQLRYAFVLDRTKNAQGDFERTGGGAANQMRIFQESLKQVAQQLGSVILPAFTKVISFVNEQIKSFSQLSETQKTLIVSIAGIAAAIGPLLSVMGSVLGFVPKLIDGFKNIATQWNSLTTLLAANPFTAIATIITAVAGTALIATSRITELTNANEEFAKVTSRATESIAKEKAELEKNLAIAKNDKLSKEERKKAIENIRAISPQYLGDITLENLETRKTTDAIKKYNGALLEKARILAAEEKLVEVQKKLLDLQMGNLDAVKPSVWQNLGVAFKTITNGIGAYNIEAAYTIEKTKVMADNFVEENAQLIKLRDMLYETIGKKREFTTATEDSSKAITNFNATTGKVLKPNTVAYFEDLIAKLKEQQSTIPTTNEAWLMYESRIEAVQNKLDALSKKEKEFPIGTIAYYKSKIELLQKEQEELTTTSNKYLDIQKQIDDYQAKIDAIAVKEIKPVTQSFNLQINNSDFLSKFAESKELVKTSASEMADSIALMNEQLSEAFTATMESFAENMAVGFGQLIGSIMSGAPIIQSIFSFLMSNIAQVMEQLGKAAIQIGITMKAVKMSFANPASAIVAGIALIAFSTLIKSFVPKDLQGFANGGIVGGSSFYGDKVLARVNSGELILNQSQQRNLWGMMDSNVSNTNVSLDGGFKLKGSDLELVIERTIAKKTRTR